MIELNTYTKSELTSIFGTRNMQGLQRKLTNYGISYDVQGRGESAIFTITNIENPFKIYCITELGFDGRTDFYKLRNYYYYFFNDIEFRAMPDEVKEHRMRLVHKNVSRQTIATYSRKLYNKNLVDIHSGDFIYYFAYEDTQRIVEKEEYSKAWVEYWHNVKNGYSSFGAIYKMRYKYHGIARKQEIPVINGIHHKEVKVLCDLIQNDIERELKI